MYEEIRLLPPALAYIVLFVIVMLRANGTYWVGRLAAHGSRRSRRLERFVNGPLMQRAEQFTARWGVLAVPLCFLTIGVQTAVNLSAGVMRMPLRRYLPAVVLGCMMWALIYATVGLAFIHAVILAFIGSPRAFLLLGVAVVVLGGVLFFHFRQTRHADPTQAGTAGPLGTAVPEVSSGLPDADSAEGGSRREPRLDH